MSCSLLSLATAVPPHVIDQSAAKELGREAFTGKKALFDRLSGVFDNAGIARRHVVAPPDWYLQKHGWQERNAVYLDAAEQLFIDAATSAIEQAGLAPDQIDGVVTVSTTGIATPSLEARVAQRLGLRANVRRVPVFGLGCAGGVNGLSLASQLALADPGSHWLFVTVETCSISIRLDSDDPAAVVATALFGDGAAAASSPAGGTASPTSPAPPSGNGRTRSGSWAGTSRIPASRSCSTARSRRSSSGAGGGDRRHVRRTGHLARRDRPLLLPPGGVKVIDAIESALDLNQGELNVEREVLHDYGNMSAPTVLFVLERLIERGLPEDSDDDRLRAWLHLRGPAAQGAVTPNIFILAIVTLQRLASCGCRTGTPTAC